MTLDAHIRFAEVIAPHIVEYDARRVEPAQAVDFETAESPRVRHMAGVTVDYRRLRLSPLIPLFDEIDIAVAAVADRTTDGRIFQSPVYIHCCLDKRGGFMRGVFPLPFRNDYQGIVGVCMTLQANLAESGIELYNSNRFCDKRITARYRKHRNKGQYQNQ